MRSVAVLGATGSIGTQALEIVGAHPDLEACALAAHSDHAGLVAAARAARRRPHRARRPGRAAAARSAFAGEVLEGAEGVERLVAGCGADIVLNAIVGAAGLRATLATFAAGADLALANKESLVAGGELVTAALPAAAGACCRSTASTRRSPSASRARPRAPSPASSSRPRAGRSAAARRRRSRDVTVADALAHPTWSMGAKITIDSATLMNKGLEVIEAHHLFGIAYDDIEVVVHPQSIVHGMARFRDGALIAHVGHPDMRVPISWALTYPERSATPVPTLDLSRPLRLDFEPPDVERVPLPRARPPGGPRGRHRAVRPERRQRGGGGRLPGRDGRLPRHRRPGGARPRARRRPSRSSRSSRCSTPTGAPARRSPTRCGRRHELRRRDLRPAAAHRHPRARPLHRGQGDRDARAALLPRLPAGGPQAHLARHRVRHRRDPARRLREDPGHAAARGGRPLRRRGRARARPGGRRGRGAAARGRAGRRASAASTRAATTTPAPRPTGWGPRSRPSRRR